MKYPKKIYLPNNKRMFDVYSSNLLEDDILYISEDYLKEWEIKTREHLFKLFDGHISIGVTIAFDELLKFIEKEQSIYKI